MLSFKVLRDHCRHVDGRSIALSTLFSTGAFNGAHMHRNGLLLVEVATKTVTEYDEYDDTYGAYDDAKGWYIAYSPDSFQINDHALSVFIYNPLNDYFDDIIIRMD